MNTAPQSPPRFSVSRRRSLRLALEFVLAVLLLGGRPCHPICPLGTNPLVATFRRQCPYRFLPSCGTPLDPARIGRFGPVCRRAHRHPCPQAGTPGGSPRTGMDAASSDAHDGHFGEAGAKTAGGRPPDTRRDLSVSWTQSQQFLPCLDASLLSERGGSPPCEGGWTNSPWRRHLPPWRFRLRGMHCGRRPKCGNRFLPCR